MNNTGITRGRFSRRLALGLLLVKVSVVLALVATEFAFRLLFRDPLGLHRRSIALGYEMVPSYSGRHKKLSEYDVRIQTNARGQRDHEYSQAETQPRILALGDSETFGWGVDLNASYPKQLEAFLRAQGRQFAVINGGVWGYNTLQEIAYLETGASGYRPDLVVVGLTSPVTLVRNLYSRELGVITIEPLVNPEGLTWYRAWLKRHSHLFSFLARRWSYNRRLLPSIADIKRLLGVGTTAPAARPADDIVAGEADSVTSPAPPPHPYPTALPQSMPDDEAVAWTVELLERLRARADAMGAPIAVVVFPELYDVFALSQGITDLRTIAINEDLVARLESRSIPGLDLSRPLMDRFAGAPLYLPRDFTHLNPLGHRVSAEAIGRFLVERFPELASRTTARSPMEEP